MSVSKKLLAAGILIISGLVVFGSQKQAGQPKPVEPDVLQIVSTKPAGLENSTILPNQILEFTFNKSFDTGRLKFRLDPAEIDLEITTPSKNPVDQTIIVSFGKPLRLGSGYTLFVFPDPANEIKLQLDKEYIFHIKTIGYKGV